MIERGLVVADIHDPDEIVIVRPSSVNGTAFPGYEEPLAVGIAGVSLLTNAPFAVIKRKRRPIRWIADISINALGGTELVWFRESFLSPRDAATAIIDCLFGNRINFHAIKP